MPLTFDGTSGFAAFLGGAGQFGSGLAAGRSAKRAKKREDLQNMILESQAAREPLQTESDKIRLAMLKEQEASSKVENRQQRAMLGLEIARMQGVVRGEQTERARQEADQKAAWDTLFNRSASEYLVVDPTPGVLPENVPAGMSDEDMVDLYARHLFSEEEGDFRNIYTAGMRTLLDMKRNGASAEALASTRAELLAPMHSAVAAKRQQQSLMRVNDIEATLKSMQTTSGGATDAQGQSFRMTAAVEEAQREVENARRVIESGKDPVAAIAQLEALMGKVSQEESRVARNGLMFEKINGQFALMAEAAKQNLPSNISADQHLALTMLKNQAQSPNADPDELESRYADVMSMDKSPIARIPGTGEEVYDPEQAIWRGMSRPPKRGTPTPGQKGALWQVTQAALKNDPALRTAHVTAGKLQDQWIEQTMKLQLERAKGLDIDGSIEKQVREAEAQTRKFSTQVALIERFAEGQTLQSNGFDAPGYPTEQEILSILGLMEEPGGSGGLEDIQSDIQDTLGKKALTPAVRELLQRYDRHPQAKEIRGMIQREMEARRKK